MLLRIGIALVAIGAVAGIAAAILWDGPDRDRTIEYRVVSEDGEERGEEPNIVVVDDEGRDGRGFFPFFPLVIVGGVLITIALISRGRGWGGWGDPRGRFEEWHRGAHADAPSTQAGSG